MYKFAKYLFKDTENFKQLLGDPELLQLLALYLFVAQENACFDTDLNYFKLLGREITPEILVESLDKLVDLEYIEETSDGYRINVDSCEATKKMYDGFIEQFNEITGRSFRGDSKSLGHFNSRIKEGYSINELLEATRKASQDEYLQQNSKYLTPEYITRPAQLEKWLNAEVDNFNWLLD